MSSAGAPMPGAALKLSTVLSLTALTVAVLQGVIGLESSRPARLSVRKTMMILAMQAFLLPIIAVAEVVTYWEALDGLQKALKHLSFAPKALLGLGAFAYVQDTLYTLYTVSSSRIYWIPLCDTRRRQDRLYETLPVVLVAPLVAILVCWRQKWGFSETIVSQGSTRETRSLATPLIGLTVLAAVVGAVIITILALVLLIKNSPSNPFLDLMNLQNSLEYRVRSSGFKTSGARDRDGCPNVDEYRNRTQVEHVVELQRGTEGLMELRRTDYNHWLHFTPLHLRNLIVGEDQFLVVPSRVPFRIGKKKEGEMEKKDGWDIFEVLSLVQLLSILPLLLLVVVAMFRLHTYFSKDMFIAFKELVDIVLVYSSLNISFGLKRLLWSFSGCYESEMFGELEMDPNMRYVKSEKEKCLPMELQTETSSVR